MVSPAPYSVDIEAKEELEKCDYSLKISTEMAKSGKVPRKVRVYATGIWDIFHQGHAECLRQAKESFPLCEVYLIAGVPSDHLTHAIKGRTVLTDQERGEILRHCRYVDEVLLDAPWTFPEEFMTKHKIDFLAHDEVPYTMGATSQGDVYAELKEKDMFVATKRTEGISTSDIITRVLQHHDQFYERNLKRGFTKSDLEMRG